MEGFFSAQDVFILNIFLQMLEFLKLYKSEQMMESLVKRTDVWIENHFNNIYLK